MHLARSFLFAASLLVLEAPIRAASCDLADVSPSPGLSAKATSDGIEIEWEGDALHNKELFWTTGEVLAHDLTVSRQGKDLKVRADVEWTFPLAFIEVNYGNGKEIFSKRLAATAFRANSSNTFEVVIPAKDARWVRFSAWDIASNGAVIQPVRTWR